MFTPEMIEQMTAMFFLRLILFSALLIACMYTDMTQGKVFNSITLPMIPLALLIRLVDQAGGWDFMYQGIVGATVCFVIFFIIWVIGALSAKPLMGGGDVKLMTAVGALMGPQFAGMVIAYSIIIGAIMSIYVLFRHGEVWAGIVGSFRRLIWPSHPNEVSEVEKRATGRTISFCTAICAAGLLTLVWHRELVFI